MPAYMIEKKGREFVVTADNEQILKFSTKRIAVEMIRAARLREVASPATALEADLG